MKGVTLVSLFLFVLFQLVGQNEKGLRIESEFYVRVIDNSSNSQLIFGCQGNPVDLCLAKDTLKVDVSDVSELMIEWDYYNELYFRRFDTIQWFFNDELIDSDEYFSDFTNNHNWRANTYITGALDTGYYQLRYLGVGDIMYSSYFPVVHVLKKEKEQLKNESTNIYPNPFSNSVHVDTEKPLDDATLIIYNTMGQEIERIRFSDGKLNAYSFDSLEAGVYVFAIYDRLSGNFIYRQKMQKL